MESPVIPRNKVGVCCSDIWPPLRLDILQKVEGDRRGDVEEEEEDRGGRTSGVVLSLLWGLR